MFSGAGDSEAAGVGMIALIALLPALLAFGVTVTIAIAWCIWLERNPETQNHVIRLFANRGSRRAH